MDQVTQKNAELAARRMSALVRLDNAAGASSWENMQESHPEIAASIEYAVSFGVTAEQIYGRLLRNHDAQFCKWVRTVARYLESVKEE